MCLMCAHTCDTSGMVKNEKYRQFPFQRWHGRQNRTFLARCGSACFLATKVDFDQKLMILSRTAEYRDFLQYARKLSHSNNENELENASTTVGKL